MNGFRHQLFPRAAFPSNEHIGRTIRDATDQIEHRLNRLALPKNVMKAVFLVYFFPEPAHFSPKRGFAYRALDDSNNFLGLDRLGEIITCASLHRLDGGFDGTERGHENHADIGIQAFDLKEQFRTEHPLHPQVGKDHCEILFSEEFQRFLSASRR